MATTPRNIKIKRTLVLALAGNITSAAIKFTFGISAGSIALISDAFHSLFDSFSSVIGIYGNSLSQKPPDFDHPYGHQKFEYATALVITTMMAVAGFNIISQAIERVLLGIVPNITSLSFAAVIVSLAISLIVSTYERMVGKETSSHILKADSFHTLTDVFASIVVIASFVGTALGIYYADSAAAIIICSIMIYVAVSLFRSSTKMLVDFGVSREVLTRIRNVTGSVCGEGVHCHSLRGRVVGDKIFIDMHITVKGDTSVEDAHKVTEILEKRLKDEVNGVEEVLVHVEPE
ncbi:MAG: cation diffusion facilitator family transporter [Candidatus Bathyarchaeia archaeon]